MYTRDCIELNNQTRDQAAAHCLKAWVVPQKFHQVCFPTQRAGLVVVMIMMLFTKMICIDGVGGCGGHNVLITIFPESLLSTLAFTLIPCSTLVCAVVSKGGLLCAVISIHGPCYSAVSICGLR